MHKFLPEWKWSVNVFIDEKNCPIQLDVSVPGGVQGTLFLNHKSKYGFCQNHKYIVNNKQRLSVTNNISITSVGIHCDFAHLIMKMIKGGKDVARYRLISSFLAVALLTVFGAEFMVQPAAGTEPNPAIQEDDVQVLDSGPIHEAFAQALVMDPEPGIVAPKEPPPLIDEMPPEQKPEGDAQWIPGYWAWDDERDDYIWVSGIWRVLPPGRQWVPGYWTAVRGGYQWIAGYWESANARETEYLPEPPESVEVGPNSNAPSLDYTWIPGCWIWDYGRYVWRPGYWARVNPNWIWVPDHYIWTLRGYIFVRGYWDYPVIHRGVLFAPVSLSVRARHLGLALRFSPGFVIDLGIFGDALFLRPLYYHYYYGHYYASEYYRRGIYPWFSLHARRVVYDPIYAHQRWQHRKNRRWEKELQTRFVERRKLQGVRPSQSYDRTTRMNKAQRPVVSPPRDFVMPLDRARKSKSTSFRFQPLSREKRRESSLREREIRTYSEKRQQRETQSPSVLEREDSRKPTPRREKFYRSPIKDNFSQKARQKKAPPVRYKAPKLNPSVEPLQRRYDRSRSRASSQALGRIQPKSAVRKQGPTDERQKTEKRGYQMKGRTQNPDDDRQNGNRGPKRWN